MTQGSLAGDSAIADSFEFRHRITDTPHSRWERLWQWAGERVNPIVVKEVRQSLKSRQFTISFGLTIVAAVSWTLIAISFMVPRIFYMPAGLPLLAGYFSILVFPLMIVIPFGAFLSLTAETEDSTFELLSISALSALQIVHGKMASACVQIMLYVSALAPCIVLTYLLRGVGLYTILVLLGWTVVFAICETAIALLLGAVARSRMVQVGAAVLALAGLFLAVGLWLSFLISFGLTNLTDPQREEYLAYIGVGSIVVVLLSLILRTAAAAIDFPSENNSTPLRRRIFLLFALAMFWVAFTVSASQNEEPAFIFLWFAFVFAMVIGALITGERGVISPRAQRSLPSSFLGRVFLTLFYPGAGLGYLFLVCLYAAVYGTTVAMNVYFESSLDNVFGGSAVVAVGYLLLCYLAIYLGANRLVLLLVPRQVPARMIGSTALLIVLLILMHVLPLFAVYYLNDYREFDYAWHQAFNIPWSTAEATDKVTLEVSSSLALVTLCAIVVFGLNLLLCTRDVMLVRVASPPRVRSEEKAVQSAKAVDPFAD